MSKTCGLLGSGFRPSDDACTFPYFVPGNAMASVYLNKTAHMLRSLEGKRKRFTNVFTLIVNK